jgi:DNA repair protein RecN (Recombination protein N)
MPAVLTLLRIKNLALVEELEWQMAQGFIAVTGETGAGKSIIIGALQLLLGERADKSLIRTGADLCTVRRRSHPEENSLFYWNESAVHQWFANHVVGPEKSRG